MNFTIDNILRSIAPSLKSDPKLIPTKDKRILLSLYSQMDQGHFLTENQSKLLTKILKENLSSIEKIEPNSGTILDANNWSKAFRVIQRVRKIQLCEDPKNTILVEFTYDKRLKEKLVNLNSKIDGTISAVGSKSYAISLTETNVHTLVSTFIKDDFQVDEKIMDFYLEIDKILRNKSNTFDISFEENQSFKKIVTDNVGPINAKNSLMLHDRKIRYQYDFSGKIEANSLVEKIASRKNNKIFINALHVSLSDVIAALEELKRLPLLTIFDGHDSKVNKKTLDLLLEAAKKTGYDDKIGIYFRFDSKNDHAGFNLAIAANNLNKNLDSHTMIAGIANSKLPKFMIKSKWKPETVISFTGNFRHNKSAVYCNDVDLIVYYLDKLPLTGGMDVVV